MAYSVTMMVTSTCYITLYGLMGELNFADFRVAFTHYRAVADGLAASGQFDLVCFGHSHEAFLEKRGETDLLNPGEVMGKDGSPGFYMIDTLAKEFEPISLL
jgi:predicted phosphodiesterase